MYGYGKSYYEKYIGLIGKLKVKSSELKVQSSELKREVRKEKIENRKETFHQQPSTKKPSTKNQNHEYI